MGVVYEAVQESLGRCVALKVLPADRGRGPFLERFRGEARSAARLHHTNIVPVFGIGRAGDTHFYGMQYIDCRGLDCLLDDVRRRRNYPGQSPRHCALRTGSPRVVADPRLPQTRTCSH
jgi:serine/threonine protein kinase